MNTNDVTRANAEGMSAANSNLHQLDGLLVDFLEAKARWNATVAPHEDLTTDSPEYEAAEAAVKCLTYFQCSSSEEATNKVRMVRDHGWLLEEAEQNLGDFLATLVPTYSDEAASSSPVHPLGFEIDNLPMKQLRALEDALSTISTVICGLNEQPMFSSRDDYNEAGHMMQDLRDKFSWEIQNIRELAEKRVVTTPEEAEAKLDILMSSMLWSGEYVHDIVADLAKFSAEMNAQISEVVEKRS